LDAFATEPELLYGKRKLCNWAVSSEGFTTEDEVADQNRIMCIVEGKYSSFLRDYKLLVSDDYFKKNIIEPTVASGRTVSGMLNMAPVKGFVVAAAKATGSKELALFVTKNGINWHRAEFGDHRIEQDSYTILESTAYSLQVEVTTERNGLMGVLFSSNSNGTYYTKLEEHVNRDLKGIMDFEKFSNIQGIFLVNIVKNWEAVETNLGTRKQLQSQITFDDGRTFEDLTVGSDKLHLFSVTDLINSGRVFSSTAPGIMMGNGNIGDHLGDFDASNLFVSNDAGKSWYKAGTEGPQFYEFGDQGSVLVAMSAYKTDFFSYSTDHGISWKQAQLGIKDFKVNELLTVPDATSLKFLVSGYTEGSSGLKWHSLTIDFANVLRKCGNSDFEDWYARKDDKGNPLCIMGHKQHFRRRKAEANCFIQNEFKEELPVSEVCECTDQDFECDFNFVRSHDRTKCEPVGRLLDPQSQCKSRDGEFEASSGWRLIPGNKCDTKSKPQKDATVKRPCSEAFDAPASGKVSSSLADFRGRKFLAMHYLERDPKATGSDETVLVLTDIHEAWKSHDHGKTWELAVDDQVYAIYPHRYDNDRVYFITPSKTVYYSVDRAKSINRFMAPDVPNVNGLPILSFHQEQPNWLLWTGDQNCDMDDHKYCKVTAHISKHHGNEDSWQLLMDHVKRCQFMYQETRPLTRDLVFCEHWTNENVQGPLELVWSENQFDTPNTAFKDVVAFATMAEFIIIAEKVDNHLSAHASIDGKRFAHAAFPPGYTVEHEQAYTVLDSATNAIFLHVTQNGRKGREYGDILKSNSNGTSYIVSIENVNRNEYGYVDWEKMQGLEGVAIVNIVANKDEVSKGAGVDKLKKTVITHDDGATWSYLPCPDQDGDGQPYNCDRKNLEKKSLHIHGYTERRDPRETFSSPSAVGLMVGVGNVGESLGPYNEGDTFLTDDGGITWRHIQKGPYMWEYGDQGSIILLVRERETPTDRVLYSRNEGKTWEPYVFTDDGPMSVERITTVPSDNSRKFLLWGRKDGKLTTVSLDFTGLSDKQCVLDKENIHQSGGDYDLWSPSHPGKLDQPDCLFGHKARYYRKKPDADCYNGPLIERLHDIEKNCSCTRQDFEW
jgi:Sortilin, neurotensin receptor 3,/Sortilin, neurotensin receptor 3, C-terminal